MGRFEDTLHRVYQNRGLCEILRIADGGIVFLVGYALLFTVATLLPKNPLYAVALLGMLALPFAAVSIARRFIQAKRPYELFDFYEIKQKRAQGRSFPSRHAYSAFAIGTALLWFSVPVGVGLLLLAVLLSVIRVMLGIHFPRDVIAGGIVGIFGSVLGMSLLSFIF